MSDDPLIELRAITRTYSQGQAAFQALRGIDLALHSGECVAAMLQFLTEAAIVSF